MKSFHSFRARHTSLLYVVLWTFAVLDVCSGQDEPIGTAINYGVNGNVLGNYTALNSAFTLEWSRPVGEELLAFNFSWVGTGWGAMGWNDNQRDHRQMQVLKFAISPQGMVSWRDAFSNSRIEPPSDVMSLPLTDLAGFEMDGNSYVSFRIPPESTDNQDVPIRDVLQRLFFSSNPTSDDFSLIHSRTVNFVAVNFLGTSLELPPVPPRPVPLGGFVSDDGRFRASWAISNEEIEFQITATEVTGWIAVGWSNSPTDHTNTDVMYCALVSAVGQTLDAWTDSQDVPQPDEEQHFALVSAREFNGETECTFRRNLQTNDDRDVPIENRLQYFSWAYHSTSDDFTEQHEASGILGINFFTGEVFEIADINGGVILIAIVLGLIGLYSASRGLYWTGKHLISWGRDYSLQDLPLISTEEEMIYFSQSPRPTDKTDVESDINDSERDVGVKKETEPKKTLQSLHQAQSEKTSQPSPVAPFSDEESENSLANDDESQPEVRSTAQQKEEALQIKEENKHLEIVQNENNVEEEDSEEQEEPTDKPEIRDRTGSARLGYPSKYARPKQTRWLTAIASSRVPWTQIYTVDALSFALYVALHFAIAYGFPLTTRSSTIWGELAAANLVLLMITAVRNSLVGFLIGWPWPRVLQFHRWLGRWVVLTIAIHWVSYWSDWFDNRDFSNMNSQLRNVFGIVALGLGVFQWVESVEFIRRKFFEWFFALHFVFIAFYVFAALHRPGVVSFVIAAAVIYLLEVLVRFFWTWLPQKTINIQVADDIAKITVPRHWAAQYKPGQYVLLNFPAVSLFEWHPFTLTSGANEANLEVHIRGLGDFSKRVVRTATKSGNSPIWVRIDGPYGRLNVNYDRYPNMVLAAAGIGITPAISILKTIYSINSRLERSDDTSTDLEHKSHLKQIYLLWTVRSATQLVLFTDLFATLQEKASKGGHPEFFPRINVSGEWSPDQSSSSDQNLKEGGTALLPEALSAFQKSTSYQVRTGRPDPAQDMAEIIDSILKKATSSKEKRTAVFACGPTKFVNQIWDKTNKANLTGLLPIDFHYETFKM